MDLAVKSGYWPLYRFNPALKEEGKNPFILDSKEPDGSLQDFLAGEVRYASLKKTFPDEFARLTERLEKEYNERYINLKRLADQEPPQVAITPADADAAAATQAEDKDPSCTLAGTAEHSRANADDGPCDDGRAGGA